MAQGHTGAGRRGGSCHNSGMLQQGLESRHNVPEKENRNCCLRRSVPGQATVILLTAALATLCMQPGCFVFLKYSF